MRLSQQQFDTAVVHQKTQAILRVIRVQRHVRATDFEDGQHPHNHLQTAFGRQPHANIRAYALLAQFVRKLVSAVVKLLVAQLLKTEGQRNGLRRAFYLGFDALMGALLSRVNRKLVVPVAQGALPLFSAQQWQVGNALSDVAAHAAQQVTPVPGHSLYGCGVEQVGGVGQRGNQAVLAFAGVQGQVELCGVLVGHLILQAQTGQLAGFVVAFALVVVGHLKQRAAAQVALRLQGFDQLLERQVLMGLGLHGSLFDLLQQVGHGGLRAELGLEHLGIDEEADQPLGFTAGAVGDGHANAYVGLSAVAVQQGLQRRQQQHEQGDALLPRQCLEAVQQHDVQFDVQSRAFVAAQRRARSIGG
ncbi:putative non-ribosomal peptide synthetase [Pseudomonas syringae pv. cilantro]|uniref:Putative non-ribosomal peptide synthetase n=1 Tax=Pseudomonas syringae pv. cilantro TaxID=81035 RepID=A0A0N0X877_PSESX|nr:putative non-ribosomal peptide synthetase [Pseudomonas syringae pv. cilantro]